MRGATQCVPLNGDRKLYSAALFVKFTTVNRTDCADVLRVEQVVCPHAQIQYVTRLGSGRIVVVVLSPRSEDVDPLRAVAGELQVVIRCASVARSSPQ